MPETSQNFSNHGYNVNQYFLEGPELNMFSFKIHSDQLSVESVHQSVKQIEQCLLNTSPGAVFLLLGLSYKLNEKHRWRHFLQLGKCISLTAPESVKPMW